MLSVLFNWMAQWKALSAYPPACTFAAYGLVTSRFASITTTILCVVLEEAGMVFAALAGIPRPGFTLTRHLADGLYPRCDHLQHTGDYLADDS